MLDIERRGERWPIRRRNNTKKEGENILDEREIDAKKEIRMDIDNLKVNYESWWVL